jgi:hypothetical protein
LVRVARDRAGRVAVSAGSGPRPVVPARGVRVRVVRARAGFSVSAGSSFSTVVVASAGEDAWLVARVARRGRPAFGASPEDGAGAAVASEGAASDGAAVASEAAPDGAR